MPKTLDELEAVILDSNSRFSVSAVLKELALLERSSLSRQNQARLLYLQFVVAHKTERYEDVVKYSSQYLTLAEDEKVVGRPVAELCYNAGVAARELNDHVNAEFFFRHAISHEDEADLSDDQRLGLRESLAFHLHENGKYNEALEINRLVLQGAEELFGSEHSILENVLMNLAQNAHALDNAADSKSYLERCLKIAEINNNTRRRLDCCFQLGALAADAGNNDLARKNFEGHLSLARELEDEDEIERALDCIKRVS